MMTWRQVSTSYWLCTQLILLRSLLSSGLNMKKATCPEYSKLCHKFKSRKKQQQGFGEFKENFGRATKTKIPFIHMDYENEIKVQNCFSKGKYHDVWSMWRLLDQGLKRETNAGEGVLFFSGPHTRQSGEHFGSVKLRMEYNGTNGEEMHKNAFWLTGRKIFC